MATAGKRSRHLVSSRRRRPPHRAYARRKIDAGRGHIPVDRADATRPDLVFLLGDTPHPHVVTVVELKSPTISLEYEHLRQLENYMRQIKTWIRTEHQREVEVQGMLIGRMPEAKTRAGGQVELLQHIADYQAKAMWQVAGLQEMLSRTRTVHLEMIQALEAELAEDEDGAIDAPPPIDGTDVLQIGHDA